MNQNREMLKAYERDIKAYIPGRSTQDQDTSRSEKLREWGKSFAMDKNIESASDKISSLEKAGIYLNKHQFSKIDYAFAMDSGWNSGIQQPNTTPSVVVPIQYLQAWVPGMVVQITSKQTAAEIMGKTIIGSWVDEQIVVKYMDLGGTPQPYNDLNNPNLSGMNVNYSTATNVRFELGLRVSKHEVEQIARIQEDVAKDKRMAVMRGLSILENQIGFQGYNNGANNTYGFLNAPNLASVIVLPDGLSGFSAWSTKSLSEIVNDLLLIISNLVTQAQGWCDPYKDETTLVLPIDVVTYLNQISQSPSSVAVSVREWLTNNYPKMRIVASPELQAAIGGLDTIYLFAERVKDGYSTDDQMTWLYAVPASLYTLGVAPTTNGFVEDYSMATAGAICKRPFLVVRATMDNGPGFSEMLAKQLNDLEGSAVKEKKEKNKI